MRTSRHRRSVAVAAMASALILTTGASGTALEDRPSTSSDAVPADSHAGTITVNLTYPGDVPASTTCVLLIRVDQMDLATVTAAEAFSSAVSEECDDSEGIYNFTVAEAGQFILAAWDDLNNDLRHADQYYNGTTFLFEADIVTVEPDADVVVDYELTYQPYAFSDVPALHPFYAEIQYWAFRSVINGYQDGSFKPSKAVARQAVAAFIVRMMEFEDGDLGDVAGDPSFSDVDASHPFFREVEILAGELGVTEGYEDGTFRPTATLSRQALAAFLYRLTEYDEPENVEDFVTPEVATFSDVPTDHPFFREIEWLVDEEITTGYEDGTFRPSAPVTRQAIAAFLERY